VVAALAAGAMRFGLATIGSGADRRTIRRLGIGLLASALVCAAGAAAAGAPWLARQYRAFTALRVHLNASDRFVDAGGYRYDLWRVGVKEFRRHPLIGVGAGNYDSEYYRLRQNPEYVLEPHSLELQIAAELGVAGLAALLLVCGGVLFAAFKRRGTLAAQDRLIKVAAAGVFVSWLVATSVDWLYDIPGLAGMAIAAAALLVAPSGPRTVTNRGRPIGRVVAVALVALLAASVARQYIASRYAKAGTGQVARSPRSAIATLQQAAQLDPYSMSALYALSAAYARLDDYPDARATLELASHREPDNYVPRALLGDLALRRGAYASAAADYRRALELNPRDPQLLQNELAAKGAVR
jgi:tetratricopeptide (TPR) repeat protein